MTDSEVLEKVIDKEGRINSSIYRYLDTKQEYAELKEYLLHRYNDIPPDMFSYKEVFWRIRNGTEVRPTCKICGAPVRFKGKHMGGKFSNGFYLTCTYEHQRLLSKLSNKDTCMRRYGMSTTLQLPEIKAKAEICRNTDKAKIKKYNTMLERYGCKHAFHTKEARCKAKESCILYRKLRSKAYKEINELLYKGINPKTFYTEIIYENNMTLYRSMKRIVDKAFQTAKYNNNLMSSKPEVSLYKILEGSFNVIPQYKDERYNFRTDFYLPDYDLFIEYQGSFFHNGHPFDVSNEYDNNLLNKLKDAATIRKTETGKSVTRYDALIDTWTVRDVAKRNMAKSNKLNYLEIFPHYNLADIPTFIRNNFSGKTDTQIIIGTDIF